MRWHRYGVRIFATLTPRKKPLELPTLYVAEAAVASLLRDKVPLLPCSWDAGGCDYEEGDFDVTYEEVLIPGDTEDDTLAFTYSVANALTEHPSWALGATIQSIGVEFRDLEVQPTHQHTLDYSTLNKMRGMHAQSTK